MHHLAILNKSWKLLPKILSGEKSIESRWYMARFPPWNKISAGDTIYFKDTGCPVTVKAEVEEVLQFQNYSETQLRKILGKYAGQICFPEEIDPFEWAKKKRYCMLIFLKNPEKITPFEIDKTGFGNACAWICIDDIDKKKIIS